MAILHEAGHELILVSSGAVAAGALGLKKRPTKIANKQASAAVGQGLCWRNTTNLLMRQIVSAQILLTQGDFVDSAVIKMPSGLVCITSSWCNSYRRE